MKIGFWIEQCLHPLFECQEYVNEITKSHTKSVSAEFCMISLFLWKLILGVIWGFDSRRLKLVHLFK